jgi:3-hydroxybutyryl-CoA dehydratase
MNSPAAIISGGTAMNIAAMASSDNDAGRKEPESDRKHYQIGDKAEMTKTFSDRDLIDYVRATNDSNPIHCNDEHTATRFKGKIVHGMLVGGLISAVLGTKMPGHGTIYVSQNMKFIKPVYVDESITARAEITAIDENRKRLFIATTCFNQKGELVLNGEAVVIPPEWLI